MSTTNRTQYDGKPYFCSVCGKFYFYNKCESDDCRLESEEDARDRREAIVSFVEWETRHR